MGNCLRKAGTTFETPAFLEQRSPHFDDVDAARQRRTGNPQALLQVGHVDRDLEHEACSELIEDARGGRVGRLPPLGPDIVGPRHPEHGAGRHPAQREPARAVEERSPVDVSVPIFAKEIERFLRKVGQLLTLHNRSSLKDVASS